MPDLSLYCRFVCTDTHFFLMLILASRAFLESVGVRKFVQYGGKGGLTHGDGVMPPLYASGISVCFPKSATLWDRKDINRKRPELIRSSSGSFFSDSSTLPSFIQACNHCTPFVIGVCKHSTVFGQFDQIGPKQYSVIHSPNLRMFEQSNGFRCFLPNSFHFVHF